MNQRGELPHLVGHRFLIRPHDRVGVLLKVIAVGARQARVLRLRALVVAGELQRRERAGERALSRAWWR